MRSLYVCSSRLTTQVSFKTRVWHPQIEPESGKPCVDFLKEQWKATSGLRDVLLMLRQLLGSPSQSASRSGDPMHRTYTVCLKQSVRPTPHHKAGDSINSAAAAEMHEGIEVFERHAAADTLAYAMD